MVGLLVASPIFATLAKRKSVQEMVDEALRHVPNNDGKFFLPYLHSICMNYITIPLLQLYNQFLIVGHLSYLQGTKSIYPKLHFPELACEWLLL
ncbi:hypothetical protein ACB092_03G151300 [Castanea dentata]